MPNALNTYIGNIIDLVSNKNQNVNDFPIIVKKFNIDSL